MYMCVTSRGDGLGSSARGRLEGLAVPPEEGRGTGGRLLLLLIIIIIIMII